MPTLDSVGTLILFERIIKKTKLQQPLHTFRASLSFVLDHKWDCWRLHKENCPHRARVDFIEFQCRDCRFHSSRESFSFVASRSTSAFCLNKPDGRFFSFGCFNYPFLLGKLFHVTWLVVEQRHIPYLKRHIVNIMNFLLPTQKHSILYILGCSD